MTTIGGNRPYPRCSVLKIYSVNASSLLLKIDELIALCAAETFNAIVVTETWLSDKIGDSEVHIRGYNLIRKDRNWHGGGVAIYLPDCITYKLVNLPYLELEFLVLELSMYSHIYTTAGFYCLPRSDKSTMIRLYNAVTLLRSQNVSNLIICGDFNIDPTDPNSPNHEHVNNILSDFCLTQVVDTPTWTTRPSSVIDLVLTSNYSSLLSCRVSPPFGYADHNSIPTELSLPFWRAKKAAPPRKTVWIYKAANIHLGKELCPMASEEDSIDVSWDCWSKAFLSIIKQVVPSRCVPIKSCTLWINSDVRRSIARRECLFNRFRRSNSQDWLMKYKHLRNKIVGKIWQAKKTFFEKLFTCSSNSKKFNLVPSQNLTHFLMANVLWPLMLTKPVFWTTSLPHVLTGLPFSPVIN